MLESLKDLDEQLREKGSRLFVASGKPEDVLPGLFEEWGVTKMTFEADFEPRSLQRDREVRRIRFWSPRGRLVGPLPESKSRSRCDDKRLFVSGERGTAVTSCIDDNNERELSVHASHVRS